MRKGFLLLFLLLQTYSVFSKSAIGEWRTHFSYHSANQVVYGDGKVYVEASNKLYSYSNTGEIETFSTLTGLNGHSVTAIAWCEPEKTLIVVYSDGNIDFLTQSGIINLSDFKNKSITAEKTIYGIRVEGSKAYLSTAIGLLVIDVAKREISNTYYLNFSDSFTKVFDAAAWGDTVTVVTESALYCGNITSNLQEASSWSVMPFVSGTNALKIVRFNNELYALAENGTLYKKSGTNWTALLNVSNTSKMVVQNGYLFICTGAQTFMYDSNWQLQTVEPIQNNDVALDPDHNLLYIASGSKGLIKLTKSGSGYSVSGEPIIPNGPASNVAWKGLFKDGSFYVTAGGQAKNWGDRALYPGDILVLKDDTWSNLNNKQQIEIKTGIPLYDFLNLAIDPNDEKHYFVTTWGEGLYEFRDSSFFQRYTNKNSPLVTASKDWPDYYIRVDGATFDSDANLWVLCSNADSALQILKNDGGKYSEWSKIYYPEMRNAPTWNSILFTRNNQVWMNSLRINAGIFVLDNNNTLENTDDDKTRWITSFSDQDGNILSPYCINCVTEDMNGVIWLGTVNGPILANNPSAIFNSNFNFTRIKIPRNDDTGNADYLLNDIRINCITVDGANRKWIGTNGNGVYLVSPDGLVQIHQFDSKNSPLPSDYIWSITIDPETGEVYIGTDAGLVSYRSDAIQGKADYGKVYVFPNPVKPEYAGQITVTGLMDNSQVRITDFAGNLMIKGISLGGQFSWDGYTQKGKKAASGVYLVFCASEDGTEYEACKFMIIK